MNSRIWRLVALAVCFAMVLAFAGCGNKSGGTYDEPEITTDYLTGEYSEQLLTDGADTVQGSVSISETDNGYTVKVEEKEAVISSDYDEGYYLADRNIEDEYIFDDDCRIMVMHDDGMAVSSIDEFIEGYNGDPTQLYTVYVMGEYAELLVPLDPMDVAVE